MKQIRVDTTGTIGVKLSRVQKKNLSALFYKEGSAFSSSVVLKIEVVEYKDRKYVFTLPQEMLDGSVYIMDIYNDDEFIIGYKIVTEDVTPLPLDEEITDKSYKLAHKQQLVNDLLNELDMLIANGYYYHESIEIPVSIIEDIESLAGKLNNLQQHSEGEVAQDAYLLRHELSLLKSMISRENETMRRLNMRTKTVPLTKKDVTAISQSISSIIADALNKKMER